MLLFDFLVTLLTDYEVQCVKSGLDDV